MLTPRVAVFYKEDKSVPHRATAAVSRRCGVLARATPDKRPPSSRGPGSAPLRMENDEQRKFGYGGDGIDGGGGDGGGSGRWEPGGGGQGEGRNPAGACRIFQQCEPSAKREINAVLLREFNAVPGLAIVIAAGLWAAYEYLSPTGKLNPRRRREERRLAAEERRLASRVARKQRSSA